MGQGPARHALLCLWRPLLSQRPDGASDGAEVARLGRLQIAHADLKVFFPEVGAQVAGFRQQRIRERDPVFRFTGTDQRQRGDLLKTTATEPNAQESLALVPINTYPIRHGLYDGHQRVSVQMPGLGVREICL